MIDHYEADVQTAQDYYPFGMIMPGRMLGGLSIPGGTYTGTTTVNGFTLPVDLELTIRTGNEPTQYVASRSIDLDEGFESGMNDDMTAYIADTSYAGGGNGGSGADGVAGNSKYRYGFNGKENDNEVKGVGDQIDYGMRVYDPRAGRFLSVDPIQAKYPGLTPYQYASNRPIDGVDLDGREWGTFTYKTWKDAQGQAHVTVTTNNYSNSILDRIGDPQYWLRPEGAKSDQYAGQGIVFHSYQEMFDAAAKFGFGEADFDANYKAFDAARWDQFKVLAISDLALHAHSTLEGHVGDKISPKTNVAVNSPSIVTDNQATRANNGNPVAAQSNRGVGSTMEDVSKRNPQAQNYEDGVIGAASDIASKKRIVPTLNYDNPNPNGKNFVKFDGFDVENKTLIDRKWNVTTFPKAIDQLRRMSSALEQNPGYKGLIEVPNQSAYNTAIKAIDKAQATNINVKIVPHQ